jgi:hypothetical protein
MISNSKELSFVSKDSIVLGIVTILRVYYSNFAIDSFFIDTFSAFEIMLSRHPSCSC